MKYYSMYIHFEDSSDTYAAVSALLAKNPTPSTPGRFSSNMHDVWWYQVVTDEEDDTFDFINEFLDILRDKYDALANLGIHKTDILFWLVYEYDKQCNMEFHPQEMKRLGESGIVLNISCHEIKGS